MGSQRMAGVEGRCVGSIVPLSLQIGFSHESVTTKNTNVPDTYIISMIIRPEILLKAGKQ